jgi:hypothetical protein
MRNFIANGGSTELPVLNNTVRFIMKLKGDRWLNAIQ